MLAVSGVSKSFGQVRALDDVSASFGPGEIHAVLGENGAGKSTLMHVLAGFVQPDSGRLELDGAELPLGRPLECRRRGIAMVHQHFTLVPNFTVEDNLALARLSSVGPLDLARLSAPAEALAKKLGWDLDLQARTGSIPVGVQQRIEIVKSLAGDSRVAIFDEPTAVLSQSEVDELFAVLRKLKEAGAIVILIAHKLQEVLAIADRVTVLRRGKVVAEAKTGEVDAARLAEWMVGELPPELQKGSLRTTAEGLRVRDLSVRGDRGEEALRSIEFNALRGEVLGIGGVDGNGQVELAEALAGVRAFAGVMHWELGPLYPRHGSPATRIAYIPQDRQTDGLALPMTVEENLEIEGHRRESLTRGPFLRVRRMRQWAAELMQRFEVKADGPGSPVGSLSGGNQQKVVVARALDQAPNLLIAVNPTRGLDVRATQYVHTKILEARDQGAAVVLISTDLDELAALASRTVFLSRGRLVEGEWATSLLGGDG